MFVHEPGLLFCRRLIITNKTESPVELSGGIEVGDFKRQSAASKFASLSFGGIK